MHCLEFSLFVIVTGPAQVPRPTVPAALVWRALCLMLATWMEERRPASLLESLTRQGSIWLCHPAQLPSSTTAVALPRHCGYCVDPPGHLPHGSPVHLILCNDQSSRWRIWRQEHQAPGDHSTRLHARQNGWETQQRANLWKFQLCRLVTFNDPRGILL